MKTKDHAARILQNKVIQDKYCKLIVQAPGLARAALPGQFAMLKVSGSDQPLLRRPLGVCATDVGLGKVEFLFEIIGEGTKALARRKIGEMINVLGPLGNGFGLSSACGGAIVLVAGGMGVVPLLFLATRLAKSKPCILIGARTKSQVLCEKQFQDLGCDVRIATDDGSAGFRGRVTQLLEKSLSANHSLLPTVLYACGPGPMLQELSRLAGKHKIAAQISLEAHMACGIGACLGCVVQTKDGFKRVCKDGPVFDSQYIVWNGSQKG